MGNVEFTFIWLTPEIIKNYLVRFFLKRLVLIIEMPNSVEVEKRVSYFLFNLERIKPSRLDKSFHSDLKDTLNRGNGSVLFCKWCLVGWQCKTDDRARLASGH